jgi:hypothetical protein
MAGQRLAVLLAATPGQGATLALLHTQLKAMPWQLYEVRRAIAPKASDPHTAGRAVRSLRAQAAGTRAAMTTALTQLADRNHLTLTAGDGIPRVWCRRRGNYLPTAEWFWVAAPAGAADKQGPGFAAAWQAALAGGQPDLFTTAA